MEATAPAQRHSFQADLGTALQIASTANTSKRRKAANKIFGIWCDFCQQLGVPVTLDGLQTEQKLCYLLVFGLRYRKGGQKGKAVRHKTVRDALQAVGQGISNMGFPDPRWDATTGKFHTLLDAFYKSMERTDDPESRSYPANILILRGLYDCLDTEHPVHGILNQHVINLIIVAFYWLLRPAEYLSSPDAESRSQAFRFCDVTLTIRGKVYSAPTAPLHDETDVAAIETASLTFTDQKNAVKGEQISQSANNDPNLCPAKAIGRLCLHLIQHNAPPTTPLYMHFNSHPTKNNWYRITPTFITNALRHSAQRLQATTGIDPALVSARSLRPGGATALLCANIDSDAIMLLGRWKSDAMLRYLRIQALSGTFSQRMLDHGSYTFHPQAFRDEGLPNEAPAAIQAVLAHNELYDSDDE